jgi:regulator of protease activity HflC (stomatin/prohibitin superfamily)
MPVSFIASLVIAILGAIVIGFTAALYRGENRGDPSKGALLTLLTICFGLVYVGLLFSASATVIHTRAVGIEVSFGKPSGTPLQNGFHMVTPWHTVEKFDTSIQTLKLDGSESGDDTPCITVRLSNQTTACVDTNLQWNIAPKGDVTELYRKYKHFDKIESTLIRNRLVHSVNNAFSVYNPLSGINGADQPTLSTDDLAKNASTELAKEVGDGINLDTLTITLVHYDTTTQTKLNSFAQALADTRIATQNTLTAQQVALANKALAAQTSVNNPGVQYQNCLNLVARLAAAGQLKDLPQTFNCGDPRSQVIVNAR